MKNHEQALLVILSYVIGFTTAFIMFALIDGDQNSGYKSSHVPEEEVPGTMEEDMGVEVMETGEGLFVKKGGQDRIISALTDTAPAEPGFHTDIVVSSVSPDGMYVHYCAETDPASGECQHFVYSVAEDRTYMVKDGEAEVMTPSAEAALVSWMPGSELNFSGRTANQASLWILR